MGSARILGAIGIKSQPSGDSSVNTSPGYSDFNVHGRCHCQMGTCVARNHWRATTSNLARRLLPNLLPKNKIGHPKGRPNFV